MQEINKVNWCENIKLLRDTLLLTQSEFADKIGVSVVTVSRYENGQFEPTIKVKRILKKLFIEYGMISGESNG